MTSRERSEWLACRRIVNESFSITV
jgi:hypothetical protein